jgi:FdhD protein
VHPQSIEIETLRMRDGKLSDASDRLALEEPLEIRLDYADGALRREKSISITMRTPGNDDELAAGFLFTEGILRTPEDVVSILPCGPRTGPHQGQNIIKVKLREEAQISWPKLERHFYATSSCGVCGKASLDALEVQGLTPISPDGFRFLR